MCFIKVCKTLNSLLKDVLEVLKMAKKQRKKGLSFCQKYLEERILQLNLLVVKEERLQIRKQQHQLKAVPLPRVLQSQEARKPLWTRTRLQKQRKKQNKNLNWKDNILKLRPRCLANADILTCCCG